MSRGLKWLLAAIGSVATLSAMGFLLLVMLLIGVVWPLELAAYLAIGWASFLLRVGDEVTLDWQAAFSAAAALAAFTAGLHLFLRWFSAARGQSETELETTEANPSEAVPWPLRWTVAVVAAVIAMFVAGISMVGVTHQAAWLATSPEPLVESSMSMRGAAARNSSQNNLKQIGLGLQGHDAARGALPAGATLDPMGRLLQSWMTPLLPYIEYGHVYNRIDLGRPWDDGANVSAFREEIAPYLTGWAERQSGRPATDEAGYALTDYAANVHVMGSDKPRPMASITDGDAQTILAGEAFANRKAWGAPANWRDPAAGVNKSPEGFGAPWASGGAQFIFADGHAKFLSDDVDPAVLQALSTPDGDDAVEDY